VENMGKKPVVGIWIEHQFRYMFRCGRYDQFTFGANHTFGRYGYKTTKPVLISCYNSENNNSLEHLKTLKKIFSQEGKAFLLLNILIRFIKYRSEGMDLIVPFAKTNPHSSILKEQMN
jgi:hypothetical protein